MNDIHKPDGWMYMIVMGIACIILFVLTGDGAAEAFLQIVFVYLIAPAVVLAVISAIFS